MPEISIIVPVYNVEQYLPAALDSLRAQTCPDWEAILVDDGSPDGCGALCDAAARQDARFRVIHQKNAGVGAARNAGLAAARGTYVQFLDSDDALEPQMVEVLCRTARQTDADLIMFGGYEEHYAADGTRTGCTDIAPVLEGVYRGDPCPQLFPQLSAMSLVTRQLFRRRCIEEGNCRFTDYKIAEDALFFVSFYRQHLHCVVGIPEKLYRYKLRASGSASQSYHSERLADNFYLSDAVEAVAKSWGLENDPACRRAVNHSRVLDLQLGIKNVCLGPLSFRQRTAWLRQALRIPAVRAAVRDMPLQDARSRNDRIKQGIRDGCLIQIVYSIAAWFVIWLIKPFAVGLVLGDADPAVTAGALDYLAVISTLFVILGFLMIFRNTLQGLGYSTMAVISGVGELIGRSFGGWLALHGLGFLGISLANPIAWGFALCYCAFMVTRMLRKEDKQAAK